MTSPVSNATAEDPRVGRSRQVVRQAVLEELADVGYGALTIEAVARRAGVGKSTIYRHWPSRVELITDAFEHAHQELVPEVGAKSARERVVRLVVHVAEVAVDPLFSRCIPALIEGAERDERLRAFHHRYSAIRRSELVAVIDDGIKAEEFDRSIDAETAAVTLLAVVFYRRFMTDEPLAPADAEAMVGNVIPLGHVVLEQPRGGDPSSRPMSATAKNTIASRGGRAIGEFGTCRQKGL